MGALFHNLPFKILQPECTADKIKKSLHSWCKLFLYYRFTKRLINQFAANKGIFAPAFHLKQFYFVERVF